MRCDAAKIPLSANLKFFLEGEEEAGSPNLARTLAAHRELLGADLWIFGDGPIDPRGLPRLALGARGVTGFRLTVYGPATQPALRPLRQRRAESRARGSPRSSPRCARADGAHHDRRASTRRRRPPATLELARTAFDTPGMLAAAGIGATESGLDYGESILRPSLNVTQLLYGGAGGQRNAIDAEATAGFDLRLVPGMTVAGARAAIEAHVRKQGYVLLDAPPTAEERLQQPAARALRVGRRRLSGGDVGSPRRSGRRARDRGRCARRRTARCGSRRSWAGACRSRRSARCSETPFVIAPIVNADNNQHAPNENLRMAEFRRGIALYAALLAEAGSGW